MDNIYFFQIEVRDKKLDLSILPEKNHLCETTKIEAELRKSINEHYRIRTRIVATVLPESSGEYRFIKNLDEEFNGVI
jgi:hypothetical protein